LKSYAYKEKESKSQPAAVSVAKNQTGAFFPTRNAESTQLQRFQNIADNSPQNQEVAQLQEKVISNNSDQPIQRFKHKETGKSMPINWDNAEEIDLMNLYNMVDSGEYEFEGNEEQQFMQKMQELGMSFDKKDDDMFSEFDGNQLDPNQQELFDHMDTTLSDKMQERKGKKLPGRSVQGDMLEWTTSTFTQDIDVNEIDANQYAMNIAGIDHLQDNSKFSFIQDKLHLSKHTANTDTYRKHYENRYKMSAKLLAEINKNGKKSQQIMQMFQDAISNNAWLHKDIFQKLVTTVNNHWKAYNKALNNPSSNTLPSLVDDETLIEQLGDSIAFTVPSDIWEALYELFENDTISKQEMNAYIRLDMSTSDFVKVFDLLSDYANPYNEKNVKEDDEDYKEENF